MSKARPPSSVSKPRKTVAKSVPTERKIALFSDVHSNLEALEAVLADMEKQKVSAKVCLGDVVGYNANPVECLERLRELNINIIKGNHDEEAASTNSLTHYREVARIGMEYSRGQLSREQKTFLRARPYVGQVRDFLVVHASLCQPEEFYYLDSYEEACLHLDIQPTKICFVGHTHVPRVFAIDDKMQVIDVDIHNHMKVGKLPRCVVNVGSVGQPRDGDSRACYAVYNVDSESIDFRRVTYDIEATRKKILEAGLPPPLGDRLFKGI
ncbi:MAG: metallophosphoesterase [Candidatus Methylacidiphilales bacterium]|nr:metallophosphoesterase family protein [Candidatus Methylacidiphilales bacterium]